MPPFETFTKMFRTVHLQNTAGSAEFNINLSLVANNIRPKFGYYNFISFSVYGPFIATSSTTTTATQLQSSELIVRPYINFDPRNTNQGSRSICTRPIKLVFSGAGRRGMCSWHWSDSGQSKSFNDTNNVTLCRINLEGGSAWEGLKDTYVDVTIRGWGNPADSLRSVPPVGFIMPSLKDMKPITEDDYFAAP